jgi:hypothetical protein
VKGISCNNSRWKAAKQSKDWRIRRSSQCNTSYYLYKIKVLNSVLCKLLCSEMSRE